MEACNAHYYATRDPLGAARRLHHRAGNQPDVRRDGRRGAGRLLDRARARRPTPSMSSLGPGAGRSPPMRCGCCAQAGFAGEVHFVETSPVLREAQASGVPDAQWHDAIGDAARRRRCCWSPMNSSMRCRSGSGSAARSGGSTLDGERSRLHRDGAIVEDSPARDEAVAAIARAARRARRRRADHRLRPCAQRARRHAAGGARPSLRRRARRSRRAGSDRPCRFRSAGRGGARRGRRR